MRLSSIRCVKLVGLNETVDRVCQTFWFECLNVTVDRVCQTCWFECLNETVGQVCQTFWFECDSTGCVKLVGLHV
jgi:hypothetical protein